MMPTNDERREVAARLRDYSTRNFDESSPWLYMSKALTGSFTAYDDASDLFTDLADLIEPEPICIANITFTAEQQEELFQRVMEEFRVNGCPKCGAKVVE